MMLGVSLPWLEEVVIIKEVMMFSSKLLGLRRFITRGNRAASCLALALSISAVFGCEKASAECRFGGFSTLTENQLIGRNGYLVSPNCNYYLRMGQDGNLRIEGSSGYVYRYLNTVGADFLTMQPDGNAVAYRYPTPLFHTYSWGHEHSRLVMQDDGNLVVYSRLGTALWSLWSGVLPTAQGGNFFLHVPGQSNVFNYYHNGREHYCFKGWGAPNGRDLGWTSGNIFPVGPNNLIPFEYYDGSCQ